MTKVKVFVTIALVLIAGLGANTYRLMKENRDQKAQIEAVKKDPQLFAKEEIQQLVSKLSKLVVLPTGEDPVVATVTDKEKLKDQPAFAKAENGDKILIYTKAQKAYIYDPNKNVLVDVIPVNIGNQQISITGVTAQNPLRLALVNGSKNAGIAADLEKRIKDKNIPGVLVVSKTTAKADYATTQVVDLTGNLSQQATEIAQLVGGTVATSTTETGPKGADLMIIIGADFK